LVGTKVRFAAVAKLKGLNKLQSLYLYKTGYSTKDWPALKKYSKKNNRYRGYNVPLLSGILPVKVPVEKY
jgi:hypothetical protein